MTSRMGEFGQRGAVIIDLIEKGGLRRHLHIIMRGDVEGPVATDAEIDPARGDHRPGDGDDLALGKRCRVGTDPRAKSARTHDASEKRVSARGDLGGRRTIKNKTLNQTL